MDVVPQDLTWRDYLGPVIARRWLVMGIVVVVAAVAYAYEARKPPVYKASTKLYVGSQGNPIVGVGAGYTSDRTVQDQATLLTTTGVAQIAAQDLGYRGPPGSLLGQVSATPSVGADVITITAHDRRPARAAQIANAFAQAYIQSSSAQNQAAIVKSLANLQQQLNQTPQRPSNSTARANILSQIQQLRTAEASGVGNATHIDPASAPSSSTSRPPWEYALFAGLAALIGSVLLAYMLSRLDTRLKSVDQALEVYERPVFAVILQDPNLNAVENGVPVLSPQSREAFRQLRIAFDVTALERKFKTILVTSAGPGEGKSSVARGLALAYAEAGRSAALIDGDLRKPSLSRTLGVGAGAGVSDVVASSVPLEDAQSRVRIGETGAAPVRLTEPGQENGDSEGREAHGITFLPAGPAPPNPSAVIETEAFRSILRQLASDHDVVIIDSSPLTLVSDIIPLLAHVDAVLLVARSGTTDKRSARHAAEVIRRVPDANFVGVVVNGLPVAEAATYGAGYYGYGYGYGYGNGDHGPSRLRRLISRS